MRLSVKRLVLTLSLGAIPACFGPVALVMSNASGQEPAEKPVPVEAKAQVAGAIEEEPVVTSSLTIGSLTIGSKAPAIDVEHWLQEGDDKLEPISNFETGKVYVVEFWATWCPPCIASMPHLAELQKEYKDKNLRIISISDEDLETVQEFLKKPVPNQEDEKTFGELTNAYSLTTDPDQSVYNDYMVAAGQGGIPTAFVVGKTGEIEWIGHPMRMDSVLDDVAAGTWDRAAFAAQMAEEKADEAAMTTASKLFQEGKIDEAAKAVSDRLAKSSSAMSVLQMTSVLLQIGQRGDVPEESLQAAADKLKELSGDAEAMLQPYMFDLRARAFEKLGRLDDAIASEQEAIKRAEGEVKERMISFLEDLRTKKDAPEESAEPKKDGGDN